MTDHEKRIYDSMLGLLSSEDNPTPLVRLNRVTPFEHAPRLRQARVVQSVRRGQGSGRR